MPAAAVVVAVLLGVWLPKLDARFDDRLSPGISSYLFGGGPDAARSVLSAIASSLITVTALTFSLTVVTLQLASNQFSPRLLRTFTSDRFVHRTLALFLATFTFALTVLRTVRSAGDERAEFVPQLSVTIAFALSLLSVIGLTLFLAHLAREIRVERMLENVGHEAIATLCRVLPDRAERRDSRKLMWDEPTTTVFPITARSSGFVLAVETQSLVRCASEIGARIKLQRRVGDFVTVGSPLAQCWADSEALSEADLDRVTSELCGAVQLGRERTGVHDVSFGLRQLTDVVCKALSPGINDPTTAVHALHQVSVVLAAALARTLGRQDFCDERPIPRVSIEEPSFGDLLHLTLTQPLQYGRDDAMVMTRLVEVIGEMVYLVDRADEKLALHAQLECWRSTLDESALLATERSRLHALSESILAQLRGNGA